MSTKDQALSLLDRLYESRGADQLRFLQRRMRYHADAGYIVQEAVIRFLRLEDPERLRNPEPTCSELPVICFGSDGCASRASARGRR